MFEEYSNCKLCPRKCGVNRNIGNKGRCHESSDLYVARAALHFWEEPCISGKEGSGTVFFSGCNLGCVYCQNSHISRGESGKSISTDRLTEIFFELKDKGANNINLVTPTHYVPHIIDAVTRAKKHGLDLPIVYNTSGYETPETIRSLKGIIDIFLTDFRYMDKEKALAFSNAGDYPEVAASALAEMFKLVGTPVIDGKTGLMKKGIIARILVLPDGTEDACNIIDHLYGTYGNDIYLSILRQYTPIVENIPSDKKYRSLARRLTTYEYDKVCDHALDIGVEKAFVQEKGTDKDSFIPDFDNSGV